MLIRILTEDRQPERVRELCEKHFPHFILTRGMGYWDRTTRPALIIEVPIVDSLNRAHVECAVVRVAQDIKWFNEQSTVLIQMIESTNHII